MVTIEEYWNEFVTGGKEDGVPNEVRNFEYFKKGFEEGVIHKMREDYDIVDLIIEILGHNASFKKFENADEFLQLLRKEYPEDYQENFRYLHSELIPYYILTGNDTELLKCLKTLEEEANELSDNVWEVLILLLCSNKIDIYQDFFHASFLELQKGNRFSPLVRELEGFKYNLILSEIFEKHLADESIDFSKYNGLDEVYGLEILEVPISEDLSTLDEEQTEINWSLVKEKNEGAFNIFKIRFAKYAREKGISFPISFYLFDKMKEYWLEHERKHGNLLVIKPDDFYHFTRGLSNMVGVLVPEVYAFLYGSFYIYDFLLLNNGMDEKVHHGYKMILANTRERILGRNYFELWMYPFVHEWDVPDGWEKEWHDKERVFFEETLHLTYYKESDQEVKKETLEKLKEILPPSEERSNRKYKIPEKDKPLFNFNNLTFKSSNPKPQIPSREVDLNNRLPKIGRNEKVTVKYENGTIKKDVKYKKVKRDVESGKCEIV